MVGSSSIAPDSSHATSDGVFAPVIASTQPVVSNAAVVLAASAENIKAQDEEPTKPPEDLEFRKKLEETVKAVGEVAFQDGFAPLASVTRPHHRQRAFCPDAGEPHGTCLR